MAGMKTAVIPPKRIPPDKLILWKKRIESGGKARSSIPDKAEE